jgi:hypothetical protein
LRSLSDRFWKAFGLCYQQDYFFPPLPPPQIM